MLLEYCPEEVYTKELDIVDAGNTCIRFTNDEFLEWYIITKTVMGKVSILKFGPIMPDIEALQDSFSVYYRKAEYKEPTIQKEINSILSDTKKKITEAEEILEMEAYKMFPDILKLFDELSKE